MIMVEFAGAKLYALAGDDWIPGQGVLPPSATRCRFQSKEESSLSMIRLYTHAIRAAWATVAWKHGPNQPWIIQIHADAGMNIFRKGASSEVYWTPAIQASSILAAARWFDWATCWPNEIMTCIKPIDQYISQ